jgi:hypothetical protein
MTAEGLIMSVGIVAIGAVAIVAVWRKPLDFWKPDSLSPTSGASADAGLSILHCPSDSPSSCGNGSDG